MAHMITEKVLVEVSRLAKTGETLEDIAHADFTKLLEEVIQQMVPANALVEVRTEQQ